MSGVRELIGFRSSSPFFGIFSSIDNRVGISNVMHAHAFSQFYRKNEVDGAEALTIGTMIFSFALADDE